MNMIRIRTFALLTLLASAALPAVTTAPAQAAAAPLNGTATLTVTTYDFCGPGAQRRQAGQNTYQLAAQFEITAAKAGENNPFSLFFSAGAAGATGSIELHSSTTVAAPSGSLALTYWQLSTDGTNLSGVLTDAHTAEAAAANLFNTSQPLVACRPELGQLGAWPVALATGSRLQGTVTGTGVTLDFSGTTTDTLAEIQLHYTA
jgi:hypothetical protein